jgi:hypothetical protein
VQIQTIIESIQHMALEGFPLIALAHQGAELVNLVVAERSVGKPQRDPSVDNRSNDRARRAQSEAASSACENRHLADNDV